MLGRLGGESRAAAHLVTDTTGGRLAEALPRLELTALKSGTWVAISSSAQ